MSSTSTPLSSSLGWLINNEKSFVRPLPDYYATIVLSSAIFFTVLYWLSDWLLPGYTKLKKSCTPGELKDLRSRVVSNAHAIYTVLAAIYLFGTDEKLRQLDMMYGSDHIALFYAVSMGYFVYDLGLLMTDLKALGGWGMMTHHLVAMSAQFFTSVYLQFQLFIVLFAITESSTPFVNNRVLFVKLDMKESFLFLLNGVAMCLGFILFRMTLVFLGIYLVSTQWNELVSAAPFMIALVISGQVILGMLNTFWTFKIVQGLIKVLTARGGKSSSSSSSKKGSNSATTTTTATSPSLSNNNNHNTQQNNRRRSSAAGQQKND